MTAGPLPRYVLPDTAEVGADGRLQVGGVDLLDLAEEYGTPLFVYDEAHLRARCREAVAAFGDGVAYGSKAFLCLAMARLAHEEGMHVDVATGGELHVALAAGVPADRLVLHGNNKSDDELRPGPRAAASGSWSTPSTRSTPGGAPRRRRAAHPGAGAGHAGRRGPHPRVRDDGPGRLQVRLRPGQRRRRPGRRPDRGLARLRAGRGPRPHRQPDLPAPLLREGGRGAGRLRGPPRPARAVPGRGTGRGLRRRRGGAHAHPVGQGPPGGVPGGRHRLAGSRPSRAGPSSPPPASPSTGWARSRTSPACAPTWPSTGA